MDKVLHASKEKKLLIFILKAIVYENKSRQNSSRSSCEESDRRRISKPTNIEIKLCSPFLLLII